MPDRLVGLVAAGQHGQVSTAQLLACGLSPKAIVVRVRGGRLWPVHVGVMSVGMPVRTDLGRWMAATLAVDGVLADRSASALLGCWDNAHAEAHVIVLRSQTSARTGIALHRVRALDPRDVTRHRGIPVTTPARTLLDLAAWMPPGQVRRALTEARVRGLVTEEALRDVLVRHPRRRGRRALGAAILGPFTRSELERRLLVLIDRELLPAPVANHRIAGDEVDLVWPDRRLAVEVDGRSSHAHRWTQDAAKDARLRAAGFTVVRLTWWDVVRDPGRTAARLRDLLDVAPTSAPKGASLVPRDYE